MKKAGPRNDELGPEYDFRDGVRGKYARAYARGSNVVILDPDVASEFRSAKAVNDALRTLIKERKPRARRAV
ncbi:MAG: hypothetical protein HY678_10920 [Chloroflexi bacterium]|nr:hypothetical protein [Chloroflexota bacterium]